MTSVWASGPAGAGLNALRLQIARALSSDRLVAGTVPPRRSGASARRPGAPEPSGSGSANAGDRSTESRGFEAPEALYPKTDDPFGPKMRDLLYAAGILMEDPARDSP